MSTNVKTTVESTGALSEHQRILKLEKEDIPALVEGLGDVSEQIDDLRSTLFEGPGNQLSVPVGLFGGISVLAAVGGIPRIYTTGKSYGAGGKQVAQEKFVPTANLVKPKKVNSCLEYTAQPKKTVTLTIVHSDGTTQTHKIVDKLSDPPVANETTKVVICYDPNTGTKTGIYIT